MLKLSYVAEDDKGKIVGYVLAKMYVNLTLIMLFSLFIYVHHTLLAIFVPALESVFHGVITPKCFAKLLLLLVGIHNS